MSTLEVYKKLYEDGLVEINRLRAIVVEGTTDHKNLYEVDDEITTWETPTGIKTSVKTKIVRGYRAL